MAVNSVALTCDYSSTSHALSRSGWFPVSAPFRGGRRVDWVTKGGVVDDDEPDGGAIELCCASRPAQIAPAVVAVAPVKPRGKPNPPPRKPPRDRPQTRPIEATDPSKDRGEPRAERPFCFGRAAQRSAAQRSASRRSAFAAVARRGGTTTWPVRASSNGTAESVLRSPRTARSGAACFTRRARGSRRPAPPRLVSGRPSVAIRTRLRLAIVAIRSERGLCCNGIAASARCRRQWLDEGSSETMAETVMCFACRLHAHAAHVAGAFSVGTGCLDA
jgi:hypothetical protein